jgi:hypothetical protein
MIGGTQTLKNAVISAITIKIIIFKSFFNLVNLNKSLLAEGPGLTFLRDLASFSALSFS